MHYKLWGTFFVLMTGLMACVKDKPNPNTGAPYVYSDEPKVFMVHEGMLGAGEGELYVWLPQSGKFYQDVFRNLYGHYIGDVFQDFCRIENQYFAAINNSDVVEVLDRFTLQKNTTILVESPRYFLPISTTSLWVTSFFKGQIVVINPIENRVIKKVELPYNNPDKMLLHQGKVYVACWDKTCTSVYILDPNTAMIIDSISTGIAAMQNIIADKYNRLWVFYGNIAESVPYGILCIDPATKEVLRHFVFPPEQGEIIKPIINHTLDTLYWLGIDMRIDATKNGVYRMAIDADWAPADPFIQMAPFQYLFALGISPVDGTIYVGHPHNFLEKSEIIVYNSDGIELYRMRGGMGIGSFYFDE